MTKISEDPRIDPRIKAVFGAIDLQGDTTVDVESREQLLEKAQTPEAEAQRQFMPVSYTHLTLPTNREV